MVVEEEHSEKATVELGVPQGTVFGPLMFLCQINFLIQLSLKFDFSGTRQIKSQNDQSILQNDLNELEKWAAKWGMRFNAKKMLYLIYPTKIIKVLSTRR